MKKTLTLDNHGIATLATLTNIETMISTLEDNLGFNSLKNPNELKTATQHVKSLVTEVTFRSKWIDPRSKYFTLNEICIRFKNLKSNISLFGTFNAELNVHNIKINCEINGFCQNTTRILRYTDGLVPLFIEIVLLSYSDYIDSFEKFWEDIPF